MSVLFCIFMYQQHRLLHLCIMYHVITLCRLPVRPPPCKSWGLVHLVHEEAHPVVAILR